MKLDMKVFRVLSSTPCCMITTTSALLNAMIESTPTWTSSIFMIFVDFGALIDCGVIILTASGFQSRRQIILIMIKNHK